MTDPVADILRPKAFFAPEPEIPPEPTEAEREEEQWQFAFSRLSVPVGYRKIPRSLSLPKNLESWAGDPWSVLIFGPNGSGKTWLAIRLLMRMFGAKAVSGEYGSGRPAMFADSALLVEDIRREIATPTDGAMFERACSAPGLLLDDFTAARDSGFARDKLSLVLRSRYNQARPTIITSDANLEALAKIEPRIASRLSAGIVLTLNGKDRRLGAHP